MHPLEQEFEILEERFVLLIKQKFDKQLERARNKELAKNELIHVYLQEYYLCFSYNNMRRRLIGRFMDCYQWGHPFVEAVLNEAYFWHEIQEATNDIESDALFKTVNPLRIVRFLAKYTAYQIFLDYLRSTYPQIYSAYEKSVEDSLKEQTQQLEEKDNILFNYSLRPFPRESNLLLSRQSPQESNNSLESGLPLSSGLRWVGTNKTAFVQHVYALFEAGLVTNESKEVTKLVEEMASIFKVELGKNWQSNHSKSINNRNNDYEPEIFDNLKQAYARYSNKLLTGKNKKG